MQTLSIVFLFVLLPIHTVASSCGEAAIPFSLEILPNGNPVLGCARPSCFGLTPFGTLAGSGTQFHAVDGTLDGFLRQPLPHRSSPQLSQLSFIPQTARCEPDFPSHQCPNSTHWVGGIAPYASPLALQCCTYEPLSSSAVGATVTVRPGEIFVGGEVSSDDRQTAFDFVANVQKEFAQDGSELYKVHVRRMACLPWPAEGVVPVETEVPALLQTALQPAPVPQTPITSTPPTPPPQIAWPQMPSLPFLPSLKPTQTCQAPLCTPPTQAFSYYPMTTLTCTGMTCGGLYCFPASALLSLPDGKRKRMDELRVDDWVRVGGDFSRVESWLHRQPTVLARFLRFRLEDGSQLTLTPRHFLFRGDCGREGERVPEADLPREAVLAEEVSVWECLFVHTGDGHFVETGISAIEVVQEQGIYAPMTARGNIVVNDVLASCMAAVNSPRLHVALSRLVRQKATTFLRRIWSWAWSGTATNDLDAVDLLPGMPLLLEVLTHVVPHSL